MGGSYRVPSAIHRDRPVEAGTQGHGVTMAVSQAGESSVQGWWPGQASGCEQRENGMKRLGVRKRCAICRILQARVDPVAASILGWRIRKAGRLETGWPER